MIHQDSAHETGVSSDRVKSANSGNSLAKARSRKVQGAIQLRLGHATWDEIATIQGYPTAAAAKRTVEAALAREYNKTDKDQLRKMAGARLDQLLRSVWSQAVDPEHPNQMAALSKARELIAQHCKLFGLDAPSEIVVTNPTSKAIEEWVALITAGQTPEVDEYDVLEGVEQEDGSYAISSAG